MNRRTYAVVAAVLLVALAGCSGFGGTGSGDAGSGPDADGDAATAVEDAGDGAGGGGANAVDAGSDDAGDASDAQRLQTRQRQTIRTGEIRLRVNDTERASERIRRLAAERGGFVSDSSQEVEERHNETRRTGTMTVRVPSEEFDATVAEIESQGEVRSVDTRSEDVTDQLLDIEARLENLRAERDRLRELYDGANDTEDVLAVQRELSDVQEEIERLEARQAALERDVALATITVRLGEEPPEPPEEPSTTWYDTGLVAAFLSSVNGVATAVRALVVAVAYLAPYALVFGLPAVGGGVVWRRLRS
ncbi:DUF4349 domain-containing protein [Halobacteriales archaeon QS_4_69_225]|nr:MAG: DUF4349 domain-containing protein [Halobacteriales archaeon QS_4_69_225]